MIATMKTGFAFDMSERGPCCYCVGMDICSFFVVGDK